MGGGSAGITTTKTGRWKDAIARDPDVSRGRGPFFCTCHPDKRSPYRSIVRRVRKRPMESDYCRPWTRFLYFSPFRIIAMSNKSIGLSDELHEYLLSVSVRETDLMARLRNETADHPRADMQIAPEQAQFLRFLVQLIGARRTLEVGVFTGYSALSVAEVLPPNGEIVACDISEEYTDVARRYWAEAGVNEKIDLHLAPAEDTLSELIENDQAGSFDFAFIDADKETYDTYYEQALQLLRPGGVIALDNVF